MKLRKLCASILVFAIISALIASVPVSAAGKNIVLGVNGLDVGGQEGHSLVITRKSGMLVPDVGNYYTWWRTAVFEYSDEAEAYVVTAVSATASGSAPKQCYVPEDGFVLAVNMGNDYGNINYQNEVANKTYEAIAKLEVGDKAYVTGMDLSTGFIDKSTGNHWDKDFTTNAKIYIGEPPKDVEIYSPDRSKPRLDEVKLSIEDGSVISGSKDWTFSWEEVEGADYYLVNIHDGVSGDIGNALLSNQKTTETSITVPVSKLVIGYTYRVAISAVSENGEKRSSFNTNVKVSAVSDRAVNGPFSSKKIVAFGDSVTAFTGWVKMLVGELGTEVINSGVGGNSTNDAVKRLKKDVLDHDPDIVIMMFGMNDQAIVQSTGKAIVSLEDYEKNYRRMIEKMIAADITVVLLVGHDVCTDTNYYVSGQYGLDYGTGNIDNYYDVVRKLAKEYDLNLVDMNADCKAETSAKICALGDGIHLSTYGHQMYAKWIGDFMYASFVDGKGLPSEEESSADESSEAVESSLSSESTVSEVSGNISEESAESDTASDGEDSNTPIIIGGVTVLALLVLLPILVVQIKKRKNK